MRKLPSIAATLALLMSLPAAAQEGEGVPLQMDFTTALIVGKGKPCLRLTAQDSIKKLKVLISRDGKTKKFSAARMASGASRSFCWKEKAGIYTYTLQMSCLYNGKQRSSTTELELSYLPPLKMVMNKDHIDMEKRTLSLQINHPADKVELVIKGKGGKVLLETEEGFGGAKPGSTLTINWDDVEGDVVRMDIKVYDTDGSWVGMAVTPWAINIPHEEVEFETDKWGIRDTEAPKLDEAIKQIHKAIKEHASDFTVTLYVGGFTDTVGGAGHNRTLSTNRAMAIAKYFRKKGVRIPIRYRGFGEEALAVPTGDNKDEPRNRRALYMLANQAPVIARIGWGGWKTIK